MDSDSDEYDSSEPHFRIRLTISNNRNNRGNFAESSESSDSLSKNSRQDAEHCDHSPFTGQNETNHCSHKIGQHGRDHRKKGRSFKFLEPQNHKSALFVNLGDNQNQKKETQLFISPDLNLNTNTSPSSTNPPTPDSNLDSSSYELIDSDDNKSKEGEESEEEEERTTHSFVVSTRESAECLDSSSYELIESDDGTETPVGKKDKQENSTVAKTREPADKPKDKSCKCRMNSSCNFLNVWGSATRRRASSVTPSAQKDSTKSTKNNGVAGDGQSSTVAAATITAPHSGRRASSSDELATKLDVPENSLLTSNRSASGNHLGINASVETVCGSDQTQTNIGGKFAPRPETLAQPTMIEIDSPQMEYLTMPFSASSHPISLDDIDQIDMDKLDTRLEDECRALEAQAQYWEQKVEELERKQFAEDVPRTLVDNIIKHRRELRSLEYQAYKIKVDSEESDAFSCEGKMSHTLNLLDDISPGDQSAPMFVDAHVYDTDDGCCINNDLDDLNLAKFQISDRWGSHLRPGQENTANVLNAVPPPRSYQHRQYLNKASSGTDSSEYSQLPAFNQHNHKIVHHHGDEHYVESDTRNSHGHHHHQHHVHRQKHHQQKRISRHHVQHQHHPQQQQQQQHHHQNQQKIQQLYVQLESSESGDLTSPISPRASPTRPNHFKKQLRSPHVIAQDSSSTTSASSSSPQ